MDSDEEEDEIVVPCYFMTFSFINSVLYGVRGVLTFYLSYIIPSVDHPALINMFPSYCVDHPALINIFPSYCADQHDHPALIIHALITR